MKKLSYVIAFSLLLSACGPPFPFAHKHHSTSINPAPYKVEQAPCDRGTDIKRKTCDRTIQENTYWSGKNTIEATFKTGLSNLPTKKVNVDVYYVYEFSPPVVTGKDNLVGQFRRGVIFDHPFKKRTLGYLETGDITRVSHKVLDFNVTASTCPREQQTTSKEVYYYRSGSNLSVGANPEPNPLEALLTLPIQLIFAMVDSLDDLLNEKNVDSTLDERVSLKPYRNSIDRLHVTWGCSNAGDFKVQNLMTVSK